jgi:hypothetical protein
MMQGNLVFKLNRYRIISKSISVVIDYLLVKFKGIHAIGLIINTSTVSELLLLIPIITK